VATILLTSGVDVKTVSARVGHSSATITLSSYAHVLPSGQERAAGVMDGILKARSSKTAVDGELEAG
jgi:hypothetical protein